MVYPAHQKETVPIEGSCNELSEADTKDALRCYLVLSVTKGRGAQRRLVLGGSPLMIARLPRLGQL